MPVHVSSTVVLIIRRSPDGHLRCDDTYYYCASELMIVKKTITKNCTQDSLAWVFLPFVHVVF